ncbi:MAG TPA: Gfo/Idh/MocA family oxidoreductase [Leeuwenhoekiella sp.]|nr:Gfo/Idh/MocA family oxidoreductase [Leeuwenhoekiella sp.]
MNKVLKMGIIGYGWVARDYMYPAMQNNERVNLVAVCSKNASEMENLPETVKKHTEMADFLKNKKLDAVYIATPNHLHKKHTIASIAAGMHVLCEKPLATTLNDAEEMINSALAAKTSYATAYDQRFHPAHEQMRQFVQQGKLGTVTQVKIDYACWLPKDWCTANWRIELEKAGGGAIIDLAPHGLDLLETLLQDKIVEIQVFTQSRVQDYAVDDGGILMLRFESGVLGSIHVGYNRPDALPRRTLEIFGTAGMLRATNTMGQDPGGNLIFIDSENGNGELIDFDTQKSPFEAQLEGFASSILDKKTPLRAPEDDLRLFSLLFNALKKENQWH